MPNIDQVQLPDGSQYNLKDNTSGYVTAGYVDDAIGALTKANVGLGNVDNTSDLNKPVSIAQQAALNGKTDTTVIAPTEATTTASRRYEIGEQFILNGVLYTATAVIASGDSIIVDTNCEVSDSITEQIKEVDAKTQHGIVELWKNSAPTSAFAGQSISFSNKGYNIDGFFMDFGYVSGSKLVNIESFYCEKGSEYEVDHTVLTGQSKTGYYYRTGQTSENSGTITITFSDCTHMVQNGIGNVPTTDTTNNILVPNRVLGLIHND